MNQQNKIVILDELQKNPEEPVLSAFDLNPQLKKLYEKIKKPEEQKPQN